MADDFKFGTHLRLTCFQNLMLVYNRKECLQKVLQQNRTV